jgi:hypothetical protein
MQGNMVERMKKKNLVEEKKNYLISPPSCVNNWPERQHRTRTGLWFWWLSKRESPMVPCLAALDGQDTRPASDRAVTQRCPTSSSVRRQLLSQLSLPLSLSLSIRLSTSRAAELIHLSRTTECQSCNGSYWLAG